MFMILLAISLAADGPKPDTSVGLAPPEEEIAPYRCDPRPCLRPQPQPAHRYEGAFSVYHPPQIQCRVAPCPRAGAIVTLPGGATVRVGRVAYAQGTAKALNLGLDPERRTIRFEGKIWITLKEQIAILSPTKATYAPVTSGASPPAPQ